MAKNPCLPHHGAVDDLYISPSLTIPASELSERFSRSSGPGGQGVNTTDSRVEMSWNVATSDALSERQRERLSQRLAGRLTQGVLTIKASENRAQLANRKAARRRLADVVSRALRPPPPQRRQTKPTRASQRRRLDAKKQRGQLKRGRSGSWD